MLLGEHKHTLDSKKRLSLPAKFRKELGKSVVLTRGLDNCLFLFTTAAWQKVVGKLESLPLGSTQSRGLARFILSGAQVVEIDAAGRALVPDVLKEFAKLERDVVITGAGDRLEVWNAVAWEAYRKLIEKDAGSMAQALGDVGRF